MRRFLRRKFMSRMLWNTYIVRMFRIMVPVKQLVGLSSSVALIFIIITTHLLLKPPASFVVLQEKANMRRTFENLRGADSVVTDSPRPGDFVVFDAEDYEGNLAFLNDAPDGWHTLVVNLRNKSNLLSCKRCLILRDSWVQSNVLDKIALLFRGEETYVIVEKMSAYVYALSRGARWIYTTDIAEPVPYDILRRVTKHEVRTSPVYQGPDDVFEPCSHFMDTFTWRGRKTLKHQGRYNVKVVSSHAVHMVVKNCFQSDMDKDAWKDALDIQAPPPYVMPGTIASVDFRNVLVSHLTAWTLVASLTQSLSHPAKPGRISADLNMIVQHTLWETSSPIGFLPGRPRANSCPTCGINETLQTLLEDYPANTTKLHCETFETVPACLRKFASMSRPDNGSSVNIQTLVDTWVKLLIYYRFPVTPRVAFTKERIEEKHVGIPVYFTPAKSMHTITPNITIPQNVFGNFCKADGKWYAAKIPKRHPITDILLVVIFNFPKYVSHIPMLEYAYGRHFKHVLYCAESMKDFEELYMLKFNLNPVTFVEIPHHSGYWGQDCMAAAVKMNYNVQGYLQMSDDVIVNVWNLHNLPRHQPWFQSSLRVAHIDHKAVPDIWINQNWWPWTLFCGQPGAVRVYDHLNRLRSNTEVGERVSKFLENLYSITNCDRCLLYEASDIFYLPAYLSSNYTFFSDVFSRNYVFLEITIPTILAGITSDSQIYRLRGNYLWFQDRERHPFVYTEFDHFYHAWKLSQFMSPEKTKFYCTEFLARVDRDVMMDRENGIP